MSRVVTLKVPAAPEFAHLARLAAEQLASRHNLSAKAAAQLCASAEQAVLNAAARNSRRQTQVVLTFRVGNRKVAVKASAAGRAKASLAS